jgi:hypothetical protein
MKRNSILYFLILVLILPLQGVLGADGLITEQYEDLLGQYYSDIPEGPDERMTAAESWEMTRDQSLFALNTNIRVNCMPSNAQSARYANGFPAQALAVWGNVNDGNPPYRYIWDYGDGSPQDSGDVTDTRFIGGNHVYSTINTYTATLTVRDADGDIDVDQTVIHIFPTGTANQQTIEVNMAIEKGLLYAYKFQYAGGFWDAGNTEYDIAGTAGYLLAFEENGHLPTGNTDTDIYAEYMLNAQNYILNQLTVTTLSGGNAVYDSNSDGYGCYIYNKHYTCGMAMLSMLGSATPNDVITTGAATGWTFFDLIQNAVDQYYYNQTDSGGQRGGWRYDVAGSSSGSDNSTAQWPILVMIQAERNWGVVVPQTLKDELQLWLTYSQRTDGSFGYTDASTYGNPDIAKTCAGLQGYALLDSLRTASAPQLGVDFINNNWYTSTFGSGRYGNFSGGFYANYGLKKAAELSIPPIEHFGSHNWYDDYAQYLIHNVSWGQQADGHWNGRLWFTPSAHITTPFILLTLTPGVVTQIPVAVIDDPGDQTPGVPFGISAENSFHLNPNQEIIDYRWNWGLDDVRVIDWGNPDDVGPTTIHPGAILPDGEDSLTVTITLRVEDNSNPPLVDFAAFNVLFHNNNHAPVAVLNGPWGADVGDPILVSAAESWDPDTLALADSIAVFEWDLDGNGTFTDFYGIDTVLVYDVPYDGQIGLRVRDTFDAWSIATEYMEILWTYVNFTATSIAADPNNPAIAGEAININGQFTVDADDTQSLDNVEAHFELDGVMVGSPFSFSGLEIGAVVDLDVDTVAPLLPGNYPILLRIDTPNAFDEFNEIDNTIVGNLNVESPTPMAMLSIGGQVGDLLDFDCLAVGLCDSMVARLTSIGNVPFELIDMGLMSPEPSFTFWGNYPIILAPGEFTDITVRFCPQDEIFYDSQLMLNLGFDMLPLDLSGCGLSPVSVEMTDFKATIGSSDVLVSWAIPFGVEHLGYRMLRAESDEGEFILLGDEMILPNQNNVYSWLDQNVQSESNYLYKVRAFDWQGNSADSPALIVYTGELIPADFSVSQNWPNPFNPTTMLEVALPETGQLKLDVYNTLGQLVSQLANAEYSGGIHQFVFDANGMSSGLYIAIATYDSKRDTIRMLLVR